MELVYCRGTSLSKHGDQSQHSSLFSSNTYDGLPSAAVFLSRILDCEIVVINHEASILIQEHLQRKLIK